MSDSNPKTPASDAAPEAQEPAAGGPKQKYMILRRPSSRVEGQVFLAGKNDESFEGATLTVTIADTNEQDAPAKVLAESTHELAKRPVSNWATFETEIDWQAISKSLQEKAGRRTTIDDNFRLSDMSISAKITGADGKLLFISKNRHPISMASEGSRDNWWYVRQAVVVVEAA